MDTRKTQTIGSTGCVSVYTYAFANPELRDRYEYIRSAEMDYNSLKKLAEDKLEMRGAIRALQFLDVDYSQIVCYIKKAFKLSTNDAEYYIKQVFREDNDNPTQP